MTGAFANRALERLRDGEALGCIWLSLGALALAEIAAEHAPDAIVFDGQHGLWDKTALHLALGSAGTTSTPLVRVAANIAHVIGEALDAGAQGIIVPLVESAAEAAAAVRAAHYPPHGNRSGGGVRPLGDFGAYSAACARNILVAVMIETQAGLDDAAAIAATPGVDMVFIGPGDLGLAVGPAALEPAIQSIHAVCAARTMPCGIFTGSAEEARRRVAQGFQFVVVEDDIRLARGGIARSLAAFQQDPA